MIRNWYNQIPHPAIKTKREITKYINWPQFTKGTRGKSNEQLLPVFRCFLHGRKFQGSIPNLCLPQAALSQLSGYRVQFWTPFCPLITQSNGGTPSRPHTCLQGLYADRARCLPQGLRFRGRILKFCLPLAIFSPLLATRPNFDPLSDPLKPKATGVHLVGPIQASQGYCYTADHKIMLLRYCSTVNFTNCAVGRTNFTALLLYC